jgi:hypothetical protein
MVRNHLGWGPVQVACIRADDLLRSLTFRARAGAGADGARSVFVGLGALGGIALAVMFYAAGIRATGIDSAPTF